VISAARNVERLAPVVAVGAVAACMVLPDGSGLRAIAIAILGTALVLSGWYVLAVFWRGARHQRLAHRLRRESTPEAVAGIGVRRVAAAPSPFVAGLREPLIFCPADLAERLEAAELRAVLLHEDHHRRTHAPLRLLLWEALAAAMPLPAIQAWVARALAAVEIEADQDALARGASRSALAAALLRLAAAGPTGAAGFATAAELRVRALLGEDPLESRSRGSAMFALGALGLALACLAFYLG
jgi:beta-lactamase regulating signal transducer with metallopeptidase domain